jgi:hypothetical protein
MVVDIPGHRISRRVLAVKLSDEPAFEIGALLGRMIVAPGIAQTVLALIRCDYLTGLNLPVRGGKHLTRSPRREATPLD